MKQCHVLSIVLLLFSFSTDCFTGAAVSHGTPGGYAGDFLMLYVRAKFVSHKYGIPYLFPPVSDSYHQIYRQLELFYSELKAVDYSNQSLNYQNITSDHGINTQSPTVYIVNHFFKMADWGDGLNMMTWYSMLHDEPFLNDLRNMIRMHEPQTPEFLMPEGHFSIAVHVRTGRGLDAASAPNHWPYKFPFVEYYISQVQRIKEVVKRPLYVHIFTDDIYPESIANEFKKHINTPDVLFGYRVENHPRQNILEDLIFMAEFDCLIRGMSHYSQIGQLIGKHKIVVYPQRFSGRYVVEVGTIIKDESIRRKMRIQATIFERVRSRIRSFIASFI